MNKTVKRTLVIAVLAALAVPCAGYAESILDTLRARTAPLEGATIPEAEKDYPLHYLLWSKQYDAVLQALSLVTDFDEWDTEGRTVLTIAASDDTADAYDMVKALLERGADPMATDGTGFTALHRASRAGTLSVVELLVDRYGADVNAPRRDLENGKDLVSDTPLALAAREGNVRIIRFLESRGAVVKKEHIAELRFHARFRRNYEELAGHLDDPPDFMTKEEVREARMLAMADAIVESLEDLGAPGPILEYQGKLGRLAARIMIGDPGIDHSVALEQARTAVRSETDMKTYRSAWEQFSRILGSEQ